MQKLIDRVRIAAASCRPPTILLALPLAALLVADSGAAAVDPPHIKIDAARVNRATVDIHTEARMPVDIGALEVDYGVTDVIDQSAVRFQYRLDGFDTAWVDAGMRRTAFYTNLPPGRYSFRVRATDGDDAWSMPATMALYLEPHLYQTGGFVVGATVVVVLGLFGIYRWRLRVLRNLQGNLMRLVRERTGQLEDANRKLAQMSYVDAVTEVANRQSFDEELAMEWRRSTRTTSRLSLLMVDIDGFKAFNDALGHHAGDECLRKVAGLIAGSVRRAGDTVARYGGEEFAVLLPDTEALGATTLAERIRAAIEDRNVWHPATARGKLTVSVGVATVTGKEGVEPSSLVRAADGALYQAKRDGRNLVRVAEDAAV